MPKPWAALRNVASGSGVIVFMSWPPFVTQSMTAPMFCPICPQSGRARTSFL